MKLTSSGALIVAVIALSPAFTRASDVQHKEFIFKSTPQGELKIHVFFPEGWRESDSRPAIIFFFGGAFTVGAPEQFFSQAEYFAGRGLVAASAEYRIRTKHNTEPAQSLEDAKSAIRWMRVRAKELGIDSHRIIGSGGSAGATCALVATITDLFNAPGEDSRISSKPDSLVLFNPAMRGSANSATNRFSPQEQSVLAKLIRPVDYVAKGLPPMILFFGTEDPLLEPAREFCREAAALGNRVDLYVAEGQKHGFFNAPVVGSDAGVGVPGWHEGTLVKADEFLVSLGYLKGKPAIAAPSDKLLKMITP